MIKIISGGQTGVDRAALDVVLENQIPCGGWCPAGRLDEYGRIPDRYPVQELPTAGFAERTYLIRAEAKPSTTARVAGEPQLSQTTTS